MRKLILAAQTLSLVTVVLAACAKTPDPLQVGGIYTIVNGKSGYGVAKLLVYEDGVCHVRMYKQVFPARPSTLDVSSLSLGRLGDPDGFGMAHLPLREAGFLEWQPELVATTPVTPDELEGYKIWKESGGGIF